MPATVRKLVAGLVLLAAAAAVPAVVPGWEYALDTLFIVYLYGALALGWNILGGFAGQISFGHAAFVGIGAYGTALLAGRGIPLWLAIPAGGLLAAAFSLAIGPPTFRLRGPYFAIATIGIGEATRLIALNWTALTGGASGLTLAFAPGIVPQYYGALALCTGAVLLSWWIVTSRFGMALAAIRADPEAAATLGVQTTIAKTQALLLSAFVCGLGGGVYAIHYLFISPDSVFGFSLSISLIIMPIVGGIGTVAGPVLGSVIYTFIREQLEANFQNLDLLAFGLLLMAIVLFEPLGLIGAFDRLTRKRTAPMPPPVRSAGAGDG